METKNLIAKQKKDEPKKNIEIEFYWGFDELEKTKDFTKQNKTKQSWNLIIIIKAFKEFCDVQLFCIHSIKGLEFQN